MSDFEADLERALRKAESAPRSRCPYCGCRMIIGGRFPQDRQRTRDHIMPRDWGGNDHLDNLRPCCRRCNENRARCGHCVGALACVLVVAEGPGSSQSARQIIRRWNLRTPKPDFAPALTNTRNGSCWTRPALYRG